MVAAGPVRILLTLSVGMTPGCAEALDPVIRNVNNTSFLPSALALCLLNRHPPASWATRVRDAAWSWPNSQRSPADPEPRPLMLGLAQTQADLTRGFLPVPWARTWASAEAERSSQGHSGSSLGQFLFYRKSIEFIHPRCCTFHVKHTCVWTSLYRHMPTMVASDRGTSCPKDPCAPPVYPTPSPLANTGLLSFSRMSDGIT